MDDQPTQSRNNPPIGFKPREFAIGLAVAVAIVFSVAGTRWFVRARTTDYTSRCQVNLLQLSGQKEHWVSNHNDVPTWTDLVGPNKPFNRMPVCPQGGTYTIGPVGQPPHCSIPEHTLH